MRWLVSGDHFIRSFQDYIIIPYKTDHTFLLEFFDYSSEFNLDQQLSIECMVYYYKFIDMKKPIHLSFYIGQEHAFLVFGIERGQDVSGELICKLDDIVRGEDKLNLKIFDQFSFPWWYCRGDESNGLIFRLDYGGCV